MKVKKAHLAVFVIALALLATGCVPKADFESKVVELELANKSISDLEADLAKTKSDAKAEAERLQGELDAANAVIEEGTGTIAELEGDLKKSKSTNESYTKKMDKANAAAKILEVWFDDSSNSITLLTTELMVAAIGDSGLEKKWTAYKESPSQDTFSAFLQAVVAIIEKNSSY